MFDDRFVVYEYTDSKGVTNWSYGWADQFAPVVSMLTTNKEDVVKEAREWGIEWDGGNVSYW